jgi:hypothetical protein
MRYILWEAEDRGADGSRVEIPDRVLDELMGIIQRGLAPVPAPADRPREDGSHE